MSIRRVTTFSLSSIIVFGLSIFSAYSQQMPNMNNDSANIKTSQMGDDEEIAHPFFTHMGMPEAVGTYSLRTSALLTKPMDGKSKGDFAFHLETGLTKFVGLHIRNDRYLWQIVRRNEINQGQVPVAIAAGRVSRDPSTATAIAGPTVCTE